jgi:4-amino-4-deoxy-L-arabinose transferase-like glycosyltransferase
LGDLVALVAAGLFTFLPPVLAHAGLATTDMALTALVGASFLAGIMWVETPNPRYSLLFGVCTGLAVLSKFSSLVFLPAAFAAALLCYFWNERPGARLLARAALRRILPFGLAVVTGALAIWAGYRFSYGKVDFTAIKMPAPELFDGIKSVIAHNNQGHPSYLLGMRNHHGWWYYYPVVLGVKTPLGFLALLFFGGTLCWKQRRKNPACWLPLAFSLGILCLALFSRINIGVRHILPVYMGFSIVAAVGAVRLLEMVRPGGWASWALGLLLCWTAAASALAHPDYIPYMNELAGSEREKVLIDSDLDWGQDMKRLSQRLREVGAREVAFNPFIIDYLEAQHGFPRITPMSPDAPSPGWNAASITVMKLDRLGLGDELPGLKLWTDDSKPTERLGYTTYLWYFPPQRGTRPRGQ